MTLLYYDPVFLEHDTGEHPECAARIVPAARRMNLLAMHMGWTRPSWERADDDLLRLSHDTAYIDFVRRVCAEGGGHLDSDTVVSGRSFEAALLAASAAADAVSQVLHGEDRQAFCLVRPPGHHALADRAMGFCLFNTIAIAAQAAIARHGVQRVLIVDWDVHHGNGTQALFWEDPRVGFLSLHRHPFYPGTGAADETGGGKGLGTKLNVPIAFGVSRQSYLDQFQRAMDQITSRIRPELILISAGFDAHRLDPVGSLGLVGEDFGLMTRHLMQLAEEYAGGRVVSVLEGGYHADALAESVDAHLHELMRGQC